MNDAMVPLILMAQEEARIEDHYWDLWGVRHDTTPDAAAQVLKMLGYDMRSAEALEADLDSRRKKASERLVPETLVLTEPVHRLPVEDSLGLRFRLTTEQGKTFDWEAIAELPAGVRPGHHQLEVRSAERTDRANLIVCPARGFLPPEGKKYAGLGVFLAGVRDAKTWGCGDFRSLEDLARWAARELHAAYVALNPLQSIHNRWPYNTSPYLPNSLLYRNFIYLDIPSLAGFAECRSAQELLADPATQAEIARLNAEELVDYEGVARLKQKFLMHVFGTFWQEHWRAGSELAREFHAFVEREGEPLRRFALHCALDEHFHALDKDVWNWPQWPDAYRDPESAACREFEAAHEWACLFHCWVQWQIDEQLAHVQEAAREAGMAIGLFHDLPLATDRYGAELWAHRGFYLADGSVGAPPDGVAPHGQDWGFPPPDRDAHRRDGYRHFAHTIRASARHGGALRMDHVMRLFRLYCIPAGATAKDGVYVKDYADELLGVLALESVRNGIVIVGEDLGTVSDGVREALAASGVLSYRLLYFERNSQTEFRLPGEYPVQALVSTTTHDLPTIAGYWQGRDIELRRECGLLPDEAAERERDDRLASKQGILNALFAEGLLPESHGRDAATYPELTGELHNAMVGFLARTPSLLLTVNQEDLTKETEQQNLPGTVHQYPNWRRKMRMTLEELMGAQDYTAMLRNWIERTGRA